MKNQLSFSQSLDGFLMASQARHLSPNTLNDYFNTFRKFQTHLGCDPPLISISPEQVRSFLSSQEVSKKTLLNYHTGLSALWTWAVDDGIAKDHIIRLVRRPKPEKKSIVPYSRDDIVDMLAALNTSRMYTRPGKVLSSHSLPNSVRNRAIILLLIDTGIRASELCACKVHQADLRNRRITVFGKGSKERTSPVSARTSQAIWRYLAGRGEDLVGDYLFTTGTSGPINRHDLRKMLIRIGKRAGVDGVTVHRFRHTFAINYLRNGGDPWSLQIMLGHTTMEMVKNYLEIASADLEKSHQKASPVDNWRL
ncbi:MAG: tyrosine-type recombinase/integrase [Anaerolineales bacterium]|nr:tyrosine-type recombinase/integrase [Anaerolineales bacterium]